MTQETSPIEQMLEEISLARVETMRLEERLYRLENKLAGMLLEEQEKNDREKDDERPPRGRSEVFHSLPRSGDT